MINDNKKNSKHDTSFINSDCTNGQQLPRVTIIRVHSLIQSAFDTVAKGIKATFYFSWVQEQQYHFQFFLELQLSKLNPLDRKSCFSSIMAYVSLFFVCLQYSITNQLLYYNLQLNLTIQGNFFN